MKKLFLFICILVSGIAFGQKLNTQQKFPTDGCYLMSCSPKDSVKGNFIFDKSKMVYYGYDRQTKIAENPYSTSKKMIKELFDYALEINLTGMTSMDESTIDNSAYNYMVIEYRIDGEVKRICWDQNATDENSANLNTLLGMMNGFW